MLITHEWFSCCWVVLTQSQGLPCFSSCLLVNRLGMHKKLGGDTVRRANPKWPKEYSVPYDIMLKHKTEESCLEGCNWALVSLWQAIVFCITLTRLHPLLLCVCVLPLSPIVIKLSLFQPMSILTFALPILFPLSSWGWEVEWANEWLCGA